MPHGSQWIPRTPSHRGACVSSVYPWRAYGRMGRACAVHGAPSVEVCIVVCGTYRVVEKVVFCCAVSRVGPPDEFFARVYLLRVRARDSRHVSALFSHLSTHLPGQDGQRRLLTDQLSVTSCGTYDCNQHVSSKAQVKHMLVAHLLHRHHSGGGRRRPRQPACTAARTPPSPSPASPPSPCYRTSPSSRASLTTPPTIGTCASRLASPGTRPSSWPSSWTGSHRPTTRVCGSR